MPRRSINRARRDTRPRVFWLAFRLACEQASHGGELAAGVVAGIVTRDRVTELGRVLAGDAEGRRSANDITLFDSTGLAIQDLGL